MSSAAAPTETSVPRMIPARNAPTSREFSVRKSIVVTVVWAMSSAIPANTSKLSEPVVLGDT